VRGRIVTAPDGQRWRVRRRWLNRPAPRPWTRWRRRRTRNDDGEVVAGWGLEALMGGVDSLAGLVVIVAAIAVLVLLVIALLFVLGIAFELVLLAAVLASGLFGRVVLRRPWTIEAVGVDDPTRRSVFAVTGWRRSRRALATLAAAMEATGPPSALPEAEPLVGVLPPADG
jgi:hypothetical protein